MTSRGGEVWETAQHVTSSWSRACALLCTCAVVRACAHPRAHVGESVHVRIGAGTCAVVCEHGRACVCRRVCACARARIGARVLLPFRPLTYIILLSYIIHIYHLYRYMSHISSNMYGPPAYVTNVILCCTGQPAQMNLEHVHLIISPTDLPTPLGGLYYYLNLALVCRRMRAYACVRVSV